MKRGIPVSGSIRVPIVRRLSTGSPAEDIRAREQQADLRGPLSCPLLYGAKFDCETPDVGAVLSIRHGLGRVPKGWLVVGQKDEPFAMLELSRDAQTLVLGRSTASSVDSRFSLWIY